MGEKREIKAYQVKGDFSLSKERSRDKFNQDVASGYLDMGLINLKEADDSKYTYEEGMNYIKL